MAEILDQAPGTELTVIDKSIDVFKNGSAILINHKNRAVKAALVGASILEQWDQAYAETDPEAKKIKLSAVDKRSNDFLANCGIAKKDMEESRKAITQLMDVIRGMYTEEEGKMDVKRKETTPSKVQTKRDIYALEVAEQKEKERKESEFKALMTQEENSLRAFARNAIAQNLLDFLSKKKTAITESFNKITLADLESKSEGLKNMSCVFDIAKVGNVFDYTLPRAYVHNDAFIIILRSEEKANYDIAAFGRDYERSISDLKSSLIDRLPAKKEELLEQKRIADEAETAREEEIRRQQEAEQKRQEDLAKAKKADKERLEREAEVARAKEAERLAELERQAEESKRNAEADQKAREEQERLRQQQEDEAAKKKAAEEIELKKVADDAAAMFTQTAEAAEISDGPESRSGIEITVKHAAGIVELFQFWFTRESTSMTIDDMMKKSIAQMKTYAEKVALREGTKISSKYLAYKDTTRSINKKAKAS